MASSIIPHERKLKCKTIRATGEVTSAGGFATINFDLGLSSNQSLASVFIQHVTATQSVNSITMLQMLNTTSARVVSSAPQTIGVIIGVLYME